MFERAKVKGSFVLLVVVLMLLGFGCVKIDLEAPMQIEGVYSYSAYDSIGALIIGGAFTVKLENDETKTISGTWDFTEIGNPDPAKFGSQVGKGTLAGEYNDKTRRVVINLNPDMADNNVFLEGDVQNGQFKGTWVFSGFSGVIGNGQFTAVKL